MQYCDGIFTYYPVNIFILTIGIAQSKLDPRIVITFIKIIVTVTLCSAL